MLCFDIQREKFQDSFWSVLLSNISAGQNAVFRPAGFTLPPELALWLMPVCPAGKARRSPPTGDCAASALRLIRRCGVNSSCLTPGAFLQ